MSLASDSHPKAKENEGEHYMNNSAFRSQNTNGYPRRAKVLLLRREKKTRKDELPFEMTPRLEGHRSVNLMIRFIKGIKPIEQLKFKQVPNICLGAVEAWRWHLSKVERFIRTLEYSKRCLQ